MSHVTEVEMDLLDPTAAERGQSHPVLIRAYTEHAAALAQL